MKLKSSQVFESLPLIRAQQWSSFYSQLLSSSISIFSSLEGKIVQNIKFSSVDQTSDLILKFDSTRQHESRGMLSFQNRTPDTKLLKFYANWDEKAYLEKCDF